MLLWACSAKLCGPMRVMNRQGVDVFPKSENFGCLCVCVPFSVLMYSLYQWFSDCRTYSKSLVPQVGQQSPWENDGVKLRWLWLHEVYINLVFKLGRRFRLISELFPLVSVQNGKPEWNSPSTSWLTHEADCWLTAPVWSSARSVYKNCSLCFTPVWVVFSVIVPGR